MSTVHNVSDITNILSGIIQSEPILQDVRVQGEVSVDGPQGVFWLSHGENKIRCFIPPSQNTIQFRSLLKAKNTVVVKGKIALFSTFSQYQILVNTVAESESISRQGIQPISVSKITTNLKSIIKTADSLRNMHVQGEISDTHSQDGIPDIHLELCDDAGKATSGLPTIKCVPTGVELPQVNLGNEVCLRGEVSIYPQKSLYQIDIGSMELVPSSDRKARCQCSGCEQCLPLLGNNHQCNRSPNPLLCPKCYAISPDHEKKVEEAVEAYFFALNVKGFSPKTQHEIQMGSDNRKPDVVLVDRDGSFAAIAECKGAGFTGDGIDQLKSYLSATDTRFGIFANRTDPGQWQFYENRRRNRFDQIDHSEFKEQVVRGITTRNRLSDEIKVLESKFNQLEGAVNDLETKKAGLAKEIEQENRKSDELKQTIEFDRVYEQDLKSAHKQLEGEIDQLRIDKAELKTAIGRFERKERELHAFREQRKEKLQRFETIFNDLKSDLLDLGLPPPPEDNAGTQKSRENKKQSIKNWFRNRFSKENE